MRDAGLTKQERKFQALLRIWMVVFFIAGCVFASSPEWTIRYIESVGRFVFNWKSAPITTGNEKFWLVLVTSLMGTITYAAYKAQASFLRNIQYANIIVISKFISTAGFLSCFLLLGHQFLYLTGAVVDGLIFVITAVLYHSALKSRPRF